MKPIVYFVAASLLLFSSFVSIPRNPLKKLPSEIRNDYALLSSDTDPSTKFISRTEVSNADFAEFVSENRGYRVYSEAWLTAVSYGEPLREIYHQHPAYLEYPVLNVSHESAVAYCEWLSTKYSTEEFAYNFKLPSKSEWIEAATAERGGPYTWGGPNLQNARGQILCNYYSVNDCNIQRDLESGDLDFVNAAPNSNGTFFTSPVKSYVESEKGLFNMNGNVAEMIEEEGIAMGGSWASGGYDVRNESEMRYDAPSPYVGFRVLLEIKAQN